MPTDLSPFGWFLRALQQYVTFSGRARRKEYWYFVLFYVLFSIGTAILDSMLGLNGGGKDTGLLGALLSIGLFLPSLAVTVRRLHDTGRSGWWILIGLIPLVGALVLLVFEVGDSDPGPNEYGANPKGQTVAVPVDRQFLSAGPSVKPNSKDGLTGGDWVMAVVSFFLSPIVSVPLSIYNFATARSSQGLLYLGVSVAWIVVIALPVALLMGH